MTNFNGRIFVGPADRTRQLPNARLDVQPTALRQSLRYMEVHEEFCQKPCLTMLNNIQFEDKKNEPFHYFLSFQTVKTQIRLFLGKILNS